MRAGYKNSILMLTIFFHQMQVVNIAPIETDKLYIKYIYIYKVMCKVGKQNSLC